MITRVLAAIALFILAVVLPWWAALPLAVAYAFFFRAYELPMLAACIDGYFGAGIAVPYYTAAAALLLVVSEWIKPSLAIVDETHTL